MQCTSWAVQSLGFGVGVVAKGVFFESYKDSPPQRFQFTQCYDKSSVELRSFKKGDIL